MKLRSSISALAIASLGLCSSLAAQDTLLHVDVPFSFRIPGTQLPAGNYDVITRMGASGRVRVDFRESTTRHTVMALPMERLDSESADAPPKLMFRCGENTCSLSKVRLGGTEPGFEFKAPRPEGPERIAIVYGHVIATR